MISTSGFLHRARRHLGNHFGISPRADAGYQHSTVETIGSTIALSKTGAKTTFEPFATVFFDPSVSHGVRADRFPP
jgi:hypothetical protein